MTRILAVLLACLALTCGPSQETFTPAGGEATLTLTNGREINAELFALQDSMIYCSDGGLYSIPLNAVERINVHMNGTRNWMVPVIACQAIPSAILLGAGGDAAIYGGLGAIVTAFTWVCFESSGPRTDFENPMSTPDIRMLVPFMRYPQGLTAEQLDRVRAALPAREIQ